MLRTQLRSCGLVAIYSGDYGEVRLKFTDVSEERTTSTVNDAELTGNFQLVLPLPTLPP
jgi:hypothetical protein